MDAVAVSERVRLLDPIDRISEIIFGLIMAVTFVGAISVATAGREDVRTALASALGCNLAWGLVDAVMYLVRTMTERSRTRNLARAVPRAGAEPGREIIHLDPPDASLIHEDALEGVRRVAAVRVPAGSLLKPVDFMAALGIFLLVVVATFPVVIPFLVTDDVALAMKLSRYVTIAMLFVAGFMLGRHAGYPRPWLTGVSMGVFGGALIVAVMALGG
jgi:VIT1/CCC1 family predicted Fe2+/Mn2+ transporter